MRKHLMLSVRFTLSIVSLLLFTQAIFADKNQDPGATVLAFNRAMTESNLESLLDTLAPGGVQYTVKSSHSGERPESLTTDLKSYWSMIAPVIFSSTKSYTREAVIIDTRKTDTMATVWAEVKTDSVRMAGGGQINKFKEIYLLIRTEAGWKIAGILDTKKLSTLKTSE